jgi:hypothetical protein
MLAGSVQAQTFVPVPPPGQPMAETPKFVPVRELPQAKPAIVQTGFTQPLLPAPEPMRGMPVAPQPRRQQVPADVADLNLRTDLPGPQRQFMRESEANFYERVRQDAKRHPGGTPAIFPSDEPVISRVTYVQPSYPRLDPRTRLPYMPNSTLVESGFVIHHRLLFEQPNFERVGYDFGVAQTFAQLGVFYYDLALLPYHACSTPQPAFESNIGKCLPGDPAPFVIPRERLSVTGLVGEAGGIIGLSYLFP